MLRTKRIMKKMYLTWSHAKRIKSLIDRKTEHVKQLEMFMFWSADLNLTPTGLRGSKSGLQGVYRLTKLNGRALLGKGVHGFRHILKGFRASEVERTGQEVLVELQRVLRQARPSGAEGPELSPRTRWPGESERAGRGPWEDGQVSREQATGCLGRKVH